MKLERFSNVLIAVVFSAVLAIAVRAGVVPQVEAFLVNPTTDGSQRAPVVAFSGSGTSLVAWDSDAGDGPAIAGRMVGADGIPTGGEISIAAEGDRSQIRPAITGMGDGGFVVAWESYEFDSEDDEIVVQRLSSDGSPLGQRIRIDESELHLHADVAAAAGGFVVVWDDGSDILGKRFSPAGEAVGGRFQVNAQQGTMYGPRIAAADSGAFAVVWEDRSEVDGDGDGVLLRRFSANAEPLGGDLQVNSTAEGDQYAPAIGMRADGGFVVVWEAYGQQATGDGAFAQIFDSGGARVGGEFRVDGGTSVYAGFVDAAPTADGFIISWNEPREDGTDRLNTFVRRFDLQGNGGGITDVDAVMAGDQAQGRIATSGAALMVTWEALDADEYDVYAQRFELAGEPLTPTPVPPATPTPAGVCPGDCDGNGVVSIAELIRAVNIALGSADIETCRAADRDGNGSVAINELITAVNSALFGC